MQSIRLYCARPPLNIQRLITPYDRGKVAQHSNLQYVSEAADTLDLNIIGLPHMTSGPAENLKSVDRYHLPSDIG